MNRQSRCRTPVAIIAALIAAAWCARAESTAGERPLQVIQTVRFDYSRPATHAEDRGINGFTVVRGGA